MRALEIRIAETGRTMMNEDDEDRGCRRATPRMFLAQTPCSRGAESIAFHRHDRPAGFHDVFISAKPRPLGPTAGACPFVIVALTMQADSINNPEHWRSALKKCAY
jgi:hypothetical protein